MPVLATSPLRHRDFSLYQLVRLFSVVAIQIESVAIGWQIYDLTSSTLALGLVGLAQFLPFVTFALPAGHAADRYERRNLLILAQVGMVICALLLFWLTRAGMNQVGWVYAVLALFGTVRALSSPAGTAFTPNLVPEAELPQAVAFSSTTWQVATIAGPALGGLLYGWWGADGAYLTSAVLGALALGVLLLIRTRSRGRNVEELSWHSLLAGFRFIRTQRVLYGTITLDLLAVLLGGAVALLPVYARDILHAGPWGLGLLRSATALGAAATALWLAWNPPQKRVGHRMLVTVAIFGAATIVFGLSTNLALSILALLVMGASDMVSVVIRRTLELTLTPDPMRGRVSATNMIAVGASNELGEARAGLSAWLFGTVPAVVLGGAGTLAVVGLWARIFPELSEVETLDAPPPD